GLILVPAAADALSIPFIASGGFADGRGLAAALVLGADGINMGTRFMCSVESPIAAEVKRRIVEATELDTRMIFRQLRNTARVARNSVSDEVVQILDGGGNFDDIRELVAGSRGRRVFEEGDLEAGIWTAGLVQGLIRDIPPAGEIVTRVVREARAVLDATRAKFSA
ncbi:nitronate monooxygenase family protein, partial [Frankia sp. EI5c]|uniref:NAD(P)H-dependent flavin oxidoreductase n=1 Tax=Frankia sp. EI5c TaxID=683316 RepID=UPI001F5B3059